MTAWIRIHLTFGVDGGVLDEDSGVLGVDSDVLDKDGGVLD